MKKTIWILLDNRIGSRHQAEGVADYLDKSLFDIIYKEIEYTSLASLPNIIRGRTLIGITKKSKEFLSHQMPDIVLSTSRRTVPVARWIKKHSPNTKLFQLLHIGRCGARDFTAIYAPEHDKDKYSAPNIKYTIGSPHFITKEKLTEAYNLWQPKFANFPHPITALIIGGSIKNRPFSLENAQNLADTIYNIKQKEGGSLLITTSRRTGKAAEEQIMSRLKTIPHYAYLWGNKDANPYLGYLACADNIIVTGDSVSMCCEATATAKPLKIFTGKDWLTKKHLRFVQSLIESGYALDINSSSSVFKPANQLNIAKDIAADITSLSIDD